MLQLIQTYSEIMGHPSSYLSQHLPNLLLQLIQTYSELRGYPSSYLSQHLPNLLPQLIQTYSEIRGYPSSYSSQHLPNLLLQLIQTYSLSQQLPNLLLQLIQTYSEIRGSILAGGYEPVSAFSCKQGRTSYTAADLPTRNQVSEAAYAASLASAGRLAALTSQVHCPTMFPRMPYNVFSHALQCFLGCLTLLSRMPGQRNSLNAH